MVGQKGVRVQAVINELGEEKIDIVMHSEDPARFIAASLSPAKDIQVQLNEEEKVATVTIPDSQLSLAIGKGGQNVRLAAKLTGWKIDIVGTGEGLEEESKVEEKVSKEGKVSDVSNAEKTEDTKIAEPAQAEVTPADVPAAEPVAEPEVQEESKVEEVAPAAEAEAPVSTEKKTDQAQEDEPKA